MNPTKFAVYGERGSATRWLRDTLIEVLPDVRNVSNSTETGWKHGLWTSENERSMSPETLIIVIDKSPLAWVPSLQRKPWHMHQLRDLPMADFIRTEAYSVMDEPALRRWWPELKPLEMIPEDVDFQPWSNVLTMWREKYSRWWALSGRRPVVTISFDLLMEHGAAYFYSRFDEVRGLLPSMREDESLINLDFPRRDYYLNREYLEDYSEEDIDWIAQQTAIGPAAFKADSTPGDSDRTRSVAGSHSGVFCQDPCSRSACADAALTS